MKIRLTIIMLVAFVLSSFQTNAQIPFEKKSKWGLIDSISNKVTVKPQYNSIVPIAGSRNFLVSTVKNDSIKKFGIIDSQGKLIAPIGADSISRFNDYLIWHGNTTIPISETQIVKSGWTLIYDIAGNLVFKDYGMVDEIFPGGLIFLKTIPERRITKRVLYDSKLNQVTDEQISIEKIIPNYFILWSRSNGYTVLPKESFEPVATFAAYEKVSPNVWLFIINGKYAFLDIENGNLTLTDFVCSSYDNNSRSKILYNEMNEPAILIRDDGKIESGKVIRDMNYGGVEFISKSESGILNIGGFECEDVVPVPNRSNNYSVKIGDRWGLYNSYEKRLLIPITLPAPIQEILRGNYVLTKGGNNLYNSSGEFVFSTDKGKICDIEDGLVYIENSWEPSAVYSISLNKWIVPSGKYDNIHRMDGGNFACKIDNIIYIISPKGVTLNILQNVSEISNIDGEYFIRVIGTNGKMGIINKNNGQWIAKCIYENDIAWGNGKKQNRRFAISKESDSGELVVVMTVSGKTIASKFFPYGSSKAAIKNFGRKYLYQSFR